jgi:hypothetical protein
MRIDPERLYESGAVALTRNLNYSGLRQKDSEFEASLGNLARPYLKIKTKIMGRDVVQW